MSLHLVAYNMSMVTGTLYAWSKKLDHGSASVIFNIHYTKILDEKVEIRYKEKYVVDPTKSCETPQFGTVGQLAR